MKIDKFEKRWIIIAAIVVIYSLAVDFFHLEYLFGDSGRAISSGLAIIIVLADYARMKRRGQV